MFSNYPVNRYSLNLSIFCSDFKQHNKEYYSQKKEEKYFLGDICARSTGCHYKSMVM